MENEVQKTKKLYHDPVLLQEVLDEVASAPQIGWIVDGTFGDGGHSKRIFTERVKKFGLNKLLSIDWDFSGFDALSSYNIDLPEVDLEKFEGKNWILVKENFAHIKQILRNVSNISTEEGKIAVMLLDLGISSRQYVQKQRGFSFSGYGKVDMRMNPDMYKIAAYDLLNILPYTKLADLFKKAVGMPPFMAAKLAKEIIAARNYKAFGTTEDIKRLNDIAYQIVPIRASSKGRIHPATLLFLALRIAVNTELSNLQEVLPEAAQLLVPGGKLLVMTYHSGEEQVVNAFIATSRIKAEVIVPSPAEIRRNSRARSAKLFIITR
jgi:16S rRNA (cytosine1402-N4)-methyltransferase